MISSLKAKQNHSTDASVSTNVPPVRNTLDSSAPTIRRGKEREKPKKKRPTKMRKIILAERKGRQTLQQYLLLGGHGGIDENSNPEPGNKENQNATKPDEYPNNNILDDVNGGSNVTKISLAVKNESNNAEQNIHEIISQVR